MKKILIISLLVFMIMGITGCGKKENKISEDAKKFKEEYESFNNTSNEYFEYRNITIEEKNPIVYSTDSEIVEKIENKETFIVYFGDPECPWCRSVIEKAMKSANDNNIDKIYYVRFWDGFHNELIRDVYELNSKNKPVEKTKGSDAYYKLLEYLDNVLKEYTLKDKNGKIISVNEKRIFLPNFVAIVDGEAKELVTGKSEKQESYNDELTKEILTEETETFNNFFSKYKN